MTISATQLRKSYGGTAVLDGVDLHVAAGGIFALLGPNGAGKTTAVRILSTLIRPDGGRATVGGFDIIDQPDKVRALIGVTGQFSAVDNLLTGRENLYLLADLHHIDRATARRRIAELLDRFDLKDIAGKPAATYSGGNRRRLDLALTLIGAPRVIFLDEPTTGLDPRSRRTMWQVITDLAAEGVTIFLTTQYLEEADQLADRIALLDRGRIVAEGSPDELKRLVPGGHIRLQLASPQGFAAAADLLGATDKDPDTLTVHVPSDDTAHTLRIVLDRLDRDRIELRDVSIHTPDLDDVFLALTGAAAMERTAR
jgi:ABC-2 type transport system ATP-binding protein